MSQGIVPQRAKIANQRRVRTFIAELFEFAKQDSGVEADLWSTSGNKRGEVVESLLPLAMLRMEGSREPLTNGLNIDTELTSNGRFREALFEERTTKRPKIESNHGILLSRCGD